MFNSKEKASIFVLEVVKEKRFIMNFLEKLKAGLGKTKTNINEKFNDVFSNFRKVDEELLEELEETLIMSDIGMETSLDIINKLRQRIKNIPSR